MYMYMYSPTFLIGIIIIISDALCSVLRLLYFCYFFYVFIGLFSSVILDVYIIVWFWYMYVFGFCMLRWCMTDFDLVS